MKILNLLAHGPAYESLSEPSVLLDEWELADSDRTSNRNDNRDWPAQLGHWVLAQRPEWKWEVWQPDARADRVYSHVFDDGVVHRLFAAEERLSQGIRRRRRYLYSEAMLTGLASERREHDVLVLHGLDARLWHDVLDRLGSKPHPPVFVIGHGSAHRLAEKIQMTRHPLTLLDVVQDHVRTQRMYKRVDAMSAPDSVNASAARSVYKGAIERLTMGCDFDFWIAPPAANTKACARSSIGVPAGRLLFLTVGRLSDSKRIDRLLSAFQQLGQRREFTLMVVGQGEPAYMRYLLQVAGPMLTDGRVVFHPHVSGEGLRRLYWAADVFVSASRSEGASVAVMEAIACGLPIVATPVGGTCEVMGGYGPFGTLPIRNYVAWPEVLRAVLEKGPPQALDRELARSEFDWRHVASRFVRIVAELAPRRRMDRSVVVGC
jgi:glycosyltransferase involved in cell wall biosynthesis